MYVVPAAERQEEKRVKHEATRPPEGDEVKNPAEERSEEITNVAKISK